jgi:hypothetical protein
MIKAGDTVAFHYSDCTVVLRAEERDGAVGLIDFKGDFYPLESIQEDLAQPNVEVNWTIPQGATIEQGGQAKYVTI